ncbi:DUF1707 SHOCT-like domain-containing protein [Jiangella gansuensis]|uniref:DUF1707 SHOCT-like domain-containing protein n=1 Tax=Jiangella gansuensis TaxID=281473 RepID=UPI00047DF5F6|nr:DUF1707 domain-containing protein [Jiangella gansuensis]
MGGHQGRRPGDADRERFTRVLEAARAEGRIDDAELSRRFFTVRYAQSMGELDAVVDDLPGAPSGRNGRSPAALIVVGVVVLVVGLLGAAVLLAGGDSGRSASDDAAVPADDATVNMFAPGALESLMGRLQKQGATAYESITVFADRADAYTQVAPNAPQYDRYTYDGGGLGESEPYGEVSGDDLGSFFTIEEFDPAVVASIAEQADDVAGLAGRGVSHVIIDRDSVHGIVVIRAYVEGDAYGSGPMLVWDGTGQHLLDDGSDE